MRTFQTTFKRIAFLGAALLLALAVACGGGASAQTEQGGGPTDGGSGTPAEQDSGSTDSGGGSQGEQGSGTQTGGSSGSGSRPDPKPVTESTRRQVRDTLADELRAAGLRLPADVTVLDLGGRVYEIRGDLTLETPAGGIPVSNATLTVNLSEPGVVTWRGVSDLPFPAIGPFQHAIVERSSRAEIGYDYGRNLRDLGAHLSDDRRYLFFSFQDGLDVATGFEQLFGESASLPAQISVPGGTGAVMVLDPEDPYLYIGGACPTFPDDKQDQQDDQRRDDSNQDDADGDAAGEVSPNREDGEDCGVGFSLNGYIPFEPVDANWLREGGATFSGQLVIDAIVPIYQGIEVDGTVVTAFSPTAYRQGGNGYVYVTVPFFKNLVSFEVPLGDASAAIEVETAAGRERTYAYFSGTFRSASADSFLPAEIAKLIPMVDNEVHVAGQFGTRTGDDGVVRVDADSFLRATGRFGYNPGFLGELTGLDLSELMVSEAELRIDRRGFLLTGSTSSSLHPAVGFAGGVEVTAFISAEDIADSYLELRGDLVVAGVRLDAGALLRLDRDGLHVDGHFVTPVSRIELSGEITSQGVSLRGLARAEFPLNVLEGLASDAESALDVAIAEVQKLDSQIAAMRKQVLDERRATSSDFQTAQAAVRAARAEVQKIQSSIDYNYARIAVRNREIASWERWYDDLAWYDKTWGWTKLSYEVTWRGTEIAGRYTAIGTLETSRAVADGVLIAAEGVLYGIDEALNAIPVDADPRVAGLIIARESAVVTLAAAREVTRVAQLGGTLAAEIEFTLDDSGIHGRADIQHCSSGGCTTLVGGSVAFEPAPRSASRSWGRRPAPPSSSNARQRGPTAGSRPSGRLLRATRCAQARKGGRRRCRRRRRHRRRPARIASGRRSGMSAAPARSRPRTRRAARRRCRRRRWR